MTFSKWRILLLISGFLFCNSWLFLTAAFSEGKSPRVFFVEPHDGDTIHSPFKVKMGIEGMEVRKAGELAENTGHHHLLIGNTSIARGEVIPADKQHIHFGGGQTETELELSKGTYTLTLQFADGIHQSYGPDLSSSITVTVE